MHFIYTINCLQYSFRDDMVDKELKSAARSLSDKLHRDKSSVGSDLISQLKKMQFKQDRGVSAKNKDYLTNLTVLLPTLTNSHILI
jgi:hypothetical protein